MANAEAALSPEAEAALDDWISENYDNSNVPRPPWPRSTFSPDFPDESNVW